MFRIRRPLLPSRWLLLPLVLLCLGLACARAQGVAGEPDFQGLAQEWLRDATVQAQSAGATKLRMEVKVGSLDSRLKLAPCGNVEPYLPPGARLWGRTRVGLRCMDGMSRWNVSLPVTVNAYGMAWVIKDAVATGAVVTQNDVVEAEVNWAEESSPVLRDKALWLGQVATRSLISGQALRQSWSARPRYSRPEHRCVCWHRAWVLRFLPMHRPCRLVWSVRWHVCVWRMGACLRGLYWMQEQSKLTSKQHMDLNSSAIYTKVDHDAADNSRTRPHKSWFWRIP